MTARDELVAIVARDPESAGGDETWATDLVDALAAEVLSAAAPAPLTPAREAEIAAELTDTVRAEVEHFIETAGWQGMELPLLRAQLAVHVAARLLPQVLDDARVVASAGPAIRAAENARSDAEAERDQARRELQAVADEIVRFGIYGPPLVATKALAKRADELATRPSTAEVLRAAAEAARRSGVDIAAEYLRGMAAAAEGAGQGSRCGYKGGVGPNCTCDDTEAGGDS